jgi:outer membrane protein assembly factor BamB
MKLALSLGMVVMLGCGSHDDQAATPTTVAEPAPPRPAPGLDLDGPIKVPQDPGTAPRRPAAPLDLDADRALVQVSVPVPPRGGTVGFTFADDRVGWAARIPDSMQLPSVAYGDDRVYVSGGFESVSFYALDATTGRIDWATTNLEDNGPTAAVIEGEDVLFNTESCTLFSLNAKTGKRNWFRYLGDPTLAQIAVTDGIVYASHPNDGAGGHYLSAFKVKTGATVWQRYIGTELLATPVIAGDSVYISTLGGQTFRIDHRTGKVLWQKPLRATTAPWIAGEEMFVTRRSGTKEQQIVVATDTGKILREHRTSSGSYANDVPVSLDDWKQVWAFEGSRPVVDRGIHYVAMGNEIVASDAKTGEAIWHRRYAASVDKRTLGSVALAGSTIVVSSRDGKIYGLDVDTGYTLWSYDIGHKVVAEPIVAQGWVYATTVDGYVIALNVADKSLDGWHMFGGNPQKNGLVMPKSPTRPAELGASSQDPAPAPAAAPAAVRSPIAMPKPQPKHPTFKLNEACLHSPLSKDCN